MEKHMKITAFISVLLLLGVSSVFALTGEEILAKIDNNNSYKTISYTGVMTVYINDKKRVKTMITEVVIGDKTKAIVEFTNTEDEGTRYLLLDKNLWIYFPDEEDVVKISGHLLKEGMMGSDVSYEDALESDVLSEKYTINLTGEKEFKGHMCYVITLNAKVKDVPYYKREMLVDKETFIVWQEEMFAKSGKLLKVATVQATSLFNNRHFPVKTEIVNKLRKNSKTVFELEDIVFDSPLNEEKFSMRYLRR